MNTGTLDSPNSIGVRFRNFSLSSEEAPVLLLLSRRDVATAPFRHAAEEKKARIQQNKALSDLQRHTALEMLRQQTEVEMRRALGDRNFHAFKAFNQWWFRELSSGEPAAHEQ
jgi:hypothetical protein